MKLPAGCVVVLGTGSDVGKSVVVTALCGILKRAGIAVVPFKAQNMSNNSYVTVEGGEMGRAQVVQAEACGVTPHVDMNPVLLKPNSDTGSQVVLNGKVAGQYSAKEYFGSTGRFLPEICNSLERLRGANQLVVVEGAGSCGEVNLRSRDIVNFQVAHSADAPVILVADIDRGGVFAQVVGTLEVVSEVDRKRVKGIIINRFRGDPRLFDEGIKWLEQRTGIPVLGLIPYFKNIAIESEDGMSLDSVVDPVDSPEPGEIAIAVIRLPHISNFTDFDALERHPSTTLHYLYNLRDIKGYDIVILPGSKNVRGDLQWLQQSGWVQQLHQHVDRGGFAWGVCGGFQMLGKSISDPQGLESDAGTSDGLGLLGVSTTLATDKVLQQANGHCILTGQKVSGYEIHHGATMREEEVMPALCLDGNNEGAISANGKVWGCYLHGVFDSAAFLHSMLQQCGVVDENATVEDSATFRDQQYELLADHFEANMDIDAFAKVLSHCTHSPLIRTMVGTTA